MMRVAVCDADGHILEQIRERVNHFWGITQCDGYLDPHDLIRLLECDQRYELVIMSIEWDGTDRGIEAGQQIGWLSPETKVIYMTERPMDYVQQIFLQVINLNGILIKPIDEKILINYLEKNLEQEQANLKDSLVIKKKGRMKPIHFDDILYMESSGHVVRIKVKQDSHYCYGRLEDFLGQLPENFIQCHKSYIVNMNGIMEIKGNQILMEDELMIPISKSRARITKMGYQSYMSGKIPAS